MSEQLQTPYPFAKGPDSIKQAVDTFVQEMKRQRDWIQEQILLLPENSNIEMNPASLNSFQINSRYLAETDNWDPFYHNYRWQYAEIAFLVDKWMVESPTSIMERVEKLMKEGKIKTQSHGERKLNPEVVLNVRTLFNIKSGDIKPLCYKVIKQTEHLVRL